MQLKWTDCVKIDDKRYRIDLYEPKQGKVVEKAIPEELFDDFHKFTAKHEKEFNKEKAANRKDSDKTNDSMFPMNY